MRVAIATESFLPQVNGVTNTVLRVAEHLRDHHHEALIIAPADDGVPAQYCGFPVATVPSLSFPGYQDVKVALPTNFVMDQVLGDFAPDVLHAAAPFVIGATALQSAARLAVPSVAVYQTDIPTYTTRYGLAFVEALAWARVRDIHSLATLTLAPSSAARDQLVTHGVPRVKIWGRGVDTTRFAPGHRDQALHDQWAPGGGIVIGYMGRLAPEKQVSDLTVLADLPGTVTVIIGAGPNRKALKAQLPNARFLGNLVGDELATALATMDIFVHPGELETFCQAIQEALASGVPVIAPAKGGPIDLVSSGRTGFLYAPGDLAAMRDDVARLVGNADQRARFAVAARAFTADRTWPALCAQLVHYYDEVITSTAAVEPDPR